MPAPAPPGRAVLCGYLVLHAVLLCCAVAVCVALVRRDLPLVWLPVPLVAAPLNGAGCWRMIRRIRGRP